MPLPIDIYIAMLKDQITTADKVIENMYSGIMTTKGASPFTLPITKDQAADFLRLFRAAVARESKDPGRKAARMEALNIVREFNNGPGDSCLKFTEVNRRQFAAEMALRIRKPSLIAQNYLDLSGGLNLCGPNMLMINFAKMDPVGFAQFAVGLADQASGKFRSWTVQPGDELCRLKPPDKLSPVDFVLLASMRYTDSSYYEFLDTIRSLTKPAMLCSWLQQAGFKRVYDQTFGVELGVVASMLNKVTAFDVHPSRLQPSQGENSLGEMEYALKNNKVIIMLGSVTLAGAMVQNVDPPARSSGMIPDLHWMLVRRVQVAGNNVTIKLYTYGRAVEKELPVATFLKYYNGYVEATQPVVDPP